MSKVITERHLGEKLPFNISNSFIVSAFLDAMDGSNIISITDKDGTIEFVNDKFCDISGYSREELIGANHRLIRHQDMPRETFRKMWKTIKGGEVWRGVVKNRAKDGGEYIVDATIVPVHDSENNKLHYVSIRHDITGVIAQDKVIKKQIVDELTGIFNRTKLIDDLIKVHFSAVSIINIDGFSKINDFYGLHIGDDVLVLVSKMLQKQFKEPTHLLYRLRGDEFAVATREIDGVETHLKILDDFLLDMRSNPFECDGHTIYVSATSGTAIEKDTILNKASMALKHARSKKKPHQLYDASLKLEVKTGENLEWASKIQEAISSGRVVTYYQPIYNMRTKEIEKYEALVRLVDKRGTVILPWQFLDIAKKTRQYSRITKIVLNSAVEMARKSGYEVAVNLAVEDLDSEEILSEIEKLLGGDSIGEKIVFEMTETEEVKSYQTVSSFINLVKSKYNSKVAIDDFGSGYSNFEHLLELDFDYLKIDGSIIQKLEDGKQSNILVEAIKAFTDKLGIKTIAEFVSTEELFDIISKKDIDYVQGYFIGKPELELSSSDIA